jgi:hypothetical protein
MTYLIIIKLSIISLLLFTQFGRQLACGFTKWIARMVWEWTQIVFFVVFVAFLIAGFIGL